MLPSPNLNDQSFEDIAEQSVKKIDRYTEGWSGADVHDPGVTLIEMLSFLKVTQQERINRVGEKSLRKFLALLGMSFECAKPSAAHIALHAKQNTFLPAGTRFRVQDAVFETVKCINVIDNEIIRTCGKYPFGKPAREGSDFLIAFRKPLPSECSVHIYIELFEDYEVKRNAVSSPAEFVPTSIVRWEYYGEADGKTDWLPVTVETDETYGLLFSGEIILRVAGNHSPVNGKWLLRCVLERDLYEVAPRVEGIFLNSAEVAQYDTKCLSVVFDCARFKADEMFAEDYIAVTGISELYIRIKDCWTKAEHLGVRHTLRKEGDILRLCVSKRNELLELFAEAGDNENTLKLVLYEKDFYNKRLIGNGSGFCKQTLQLPKGACANGLEIMVSEKGAFSVYEAVSDFDGSKPQDRHFIYNELTRTIVFGDNIRGRVPFAGADIIITCLKTTLGAGGAVRDNCITEPERADLFPITVYRHKNGAAGKDAEIIEDALSRIPAELKRICRAVTLSDYEEIAKNTQGLMLKNTAAIPLYSPAGEQTENAVTVVVEPFYEERRLSDDIYLKNVKKTLEKTRLAATRVYAVFPVYLGLETYCEVVVRERGAGIAEKIAEEIKRYAEALPLGGKVSHAGVCGVAERVEGVCRLKYLFMEVTGVAVKNELGDIEIPRHAKIILKSADITEVLR